MSFIRNYLAGGVCRSNARLEDKIVVITGANTGIGKCTVEDLLCRGATVYMLCRNMEKGETARKELVEKCDNEKAFLVEMDLSSINSINEASKVLHEKLDKINLLILNAGIMACEERKTHDNFEAQLGTNHFGHFLLTSQLFDLINQKNEDNKKNRIIAVSSMAHNYSDQLKFSNEFYDEPKNYKENEITDFNFTKGGYGRWLAYGRSKLANILFIKEMKRRLAESGNNFINTYAVHPGFVQTELQRNMTSVQNFFGELLAKVVAKKPMEGAQTTIECAIGEDREFESGLYYSDCAVKGPSKYGVDTDMAKALWKWTEKELDVKFL
ncbi:hypothetical protein SNEBB_000940 [Seison nebaliae]|nr:hypothetical protein SNEBB_000940 [Seison nebaliae]